MTVYPLLPEPEARFRKFRIARMFFADDHLAPIFADRLASALARGNVYEALTWHEALRHNAILQWKRDCRRAQA